MSSRLINVRLDTDLQRKVDALRRKGITVSELVREAIESRYRESIAPPRKRDVQKMMDRLFELYPDPPNLPPRDYDVNDRFAAREAILRKLRRGKQ